MSRVFVCTWKSRSELVVYSAKQGSKVEHMAVDKAKSVAAVEEKWRYCSVCRRNHDEGRKHIFTKQHKNRLSVILSKFTKKVELAVLYGTGILGLYLICDDMTYNL